LIGSIKYFVKKIDIIELPLLRPRQAIGAAEYQKICRSPSLVFPRRETLDRSAESESANAVPEGVNRTELGN